MLRRAESARDDRHRWLVLGVLALIAYLSTLQTAAAQKIAIPQLPAPSGPFGIGRVAYHWMDSTRADVESPDPSARRELAVAKRSQFPVVIFSHGVGGSSFESTGLFEDLVSHGYVVAAVEHTYLAAAVAFPSGRIVVCHQSMFTAATPQECLSQMVVWARQLTETTAADLRFVLDKMTQLNSAAEKPSILAGRLDLNRIAALGHSAGGSAAARACQLDQRIKACISLDGEANPEGAFLNYPGAKSPSQPFLLVEVPHTPTDEELVRMGETRGTIQ